MPLTPNGALTAYATPADLRSFYDLRSISDLVADAGLRTGGSPNPDPAVFDTDPKIQDALDAGAGLIEFACLKGGRYRAEDLQALNGVSKRFLVKLNCRLAIGEIWEHRLNPQAPIPPSYQMGLEILKSLADGDRIFAFVEVEAADLPLANVMGPQDVQDQGFLVVQASRFFGTRGDQSLPIAPTHP